MNLDRIVGFGWESVEYTLYGREITFKDVIFHDDIYRCPCHYTTGYKQCEDGFPKYYNDRCERARVFAMKGTKLKSVVATFYGDYIHMVIRKHTDVYEDTLSMRRRGGIGWCFIPDK